MAKDRTHLDAVIANVITAAKTLGDAKGAEMLLANKRAIIKPEAIARMMCKKDELTGKEYSATAAEKVLILDPVYAECLKDERLATSYTIEAMGRYEAAKLTAKLAITICEIEELDAVRMTLGSDHTVQVG